MRFIATSPVEKIFSFKLGETSLKILSAVTERYLLCTTERTFKAQSNFIIRASRKAGNFHKRKNALSDNRPRGSEAQKPQSQLPIRKIP